MTSTALLVLTSLCMALGLVNLYSAAMAPDGSIGSAFSAQSTHAVLGLIAYTLLSRIPLSRLRAYAVPAWVGGVLLLVLTLVVGNIAGGARSWLVLGGPFRLQPSELMKVILPMALAAELTHPPRSHPRSSPRERLVRWARVSTLFLVPIGLIVLQPDMGSAGLLVAGGVSLVWISGIPRRIQLLGVVGGLATAPLGWWALHDYQRARILTFLDPTRDPSGDGYQTLQSLYAVASGHLSGRGFLTGTQGRLGFLPEHTTDFIFAHLAEEWGLAGALCVLGLLFSILVLGLSIAERARDRFTTLLASGLSIQLFWQIAVNLGGVLGLLPLTGVTLPLFSYGGSSLIVVWATVGLLSAAARTQRHRRRLVGSTPTSRGTPSPPSRYLGSVPRRTGNA